VRPLVERIPSERRERIRKRLRRLRRPAWFGTLRRTTPLSEVWGRDRGTPLDRYYIEHFLERERSVIRGRVLEVLDDAYTREFGVNVGRSDVLDIDPENTAATLVADLAAADAIPSESFDCFILTQTLQYVYDVRSAIDHVHRVLAPGGVVLCTLPSVSRIARKYPDTDHWRFTAASARSLFAARFGDKNVVVESYGNILTSIAFLTGIAAEELSQRELDETDPFFPLLIAVRARRARAAGS
jgi:SAM-dependent methyltransferase